MLDHATPFPTAPVPIVAVIVPAIAMLVPVVAVVKNPHIAGDTGGGNNLDLQCQVSNESD